MSPDQTYKNYHLTNEEELVLWNFITAKEAKKEASASATMKSIILPS